MVRMKDVVSAVNDRAKTAMALAGYDAPQCTSYNRESVTRPSCRTMIDSSVRINPNGWFTRRFNVLVIFYPKNENKPHGELRIMDDCMLQAFCNPIRFFDSDGIRWEKSVNADGIDQDISNGCLLTTMTYDFDFDLESIEFDPADQECMETLKMNVEEGGEV